MTNQGVNFQLPLGGQFSVAVDTPGQENPAGGVRNSNWGGVHARNYKKASPGISVCLALHALPAAYQRIWSTHSGGVEEILAQGSSTRPHRPRMRTGMLRLASRFRAFHRAGLTCILPWARCSTLILGAVVFAFSGSTHAASRDEAAMITRTVTRSAWISTKASFENNGESHMKSPRLSRSCPVLGIVATGP
jgi:hypothetical protein